MFCYQCEQTSKETGCVKTGVCGKQPDTAVLQDLLVYAIKGLSEVALAAAQAGIKDQKVNKFACEAIFSTLTNVDFDDDRFVALINQSVDVREQLKTQLEVEFRPGAATFIPEPSKGGMLIQGESVGVMVDKKISKDIRSLRELVVYGVKGLAAYVAHAQVLVQIDQEIYEFIYEALVATTDASKTIDDYVALALKCGEVNLRAMELLDGGHTGRYGHPVPTSVPLGPKKGKAILISGHDLHDLELLLQQTEGKGVNIYTHGEMLPGHGYPELKKYTHFYGHYGTAWQNQAKEFNAFPGPILMTTNCIQEPKVSYLDRIFTTGQVGWPGAPHIADKDFTVVIDKALEMSGFEEDVPGKSVNVGFARNAVMNVAPQVIDAVKNKAIRHFFLVGGCDGAKPGRNYYSDLVENVPEDCVVLTLGCGKFRFFDQDLGDIGGIPRLLDVGQCNDAYSAIQIAVALAGAFECDVNDLPLSLVLSWYEQKAAVVLLSLLFLGIKDIRLGPSLPAFLSPNVLNVLVENFNIMPISTADEDLKLILG